MLEVEDQQRLESYEYAHHVMYLATWAARYLDENKDRFCTLDTFIDNMRHCLPEDRQNFSFSEVSFAWYLAEHYSEDTLVKKLETYT